MIVIVGSDARKRLYPCCAAGAYQGQYFRACRAAAGRPPDYGQPPGGIGCIITATRA
jgi:hypothetical protein